MSYELTKHATGQMWEHEPTGETGTAPTFEEAMTQIKQHHANTMNSTKTQTIEVGGCLYDAYKAAHFQPASAYVQPGDWVICAGKLNAQRLGLQYAAIYNVMLLDGEIVFVHPSGKSMTHEATKALAGEFLKL